MPASPLRDSTSSMFSHFRHADIAAQVELHTFCPEGAYCVPAATNRRWIK